jgi:hypothetical protein
MKVAVAQIRERFKSRSFDCLRTVMMMMLILRLAQTVELRIDKPLRLVVMDLPSCITEFHPQAADILPHVQIRAALSTGRKKVTRMGRFAPCHPPFQHIDGCPAAINVSIIN